MIFCVCLYLSLNLQDIEEEEEEEEDEDNSDDDCLQTPGLLKWAGESMTDKVMTMWLNRKENLSHDYSLVGFLLSPNPTIMAAAEKEITEEHRAAVARLIEKLFVDPILVG